MFGEVNTIQHPYGILSSEQITTLELELVAFRIDPPASKGGLGKPEHFWNAVKILWPEKIDGKKNPDAFIRNPWAEKMANEVAYRPALAVIGGLNSNKTDFFAVWSIVSWLSDPWGTMVLLTSTSLGDSKRRIWGSVKKYFQANPGLPGRLIDSLVTIKTDDGSGRSDDKCGITLIAGEKKKEKEAVGKLIGIKKGKLLFVCDELPELSPALAEAFFSNLAPSNPNATMVGIGNFNSIFDALGTFCTPKQGWGSVSTDDTEWECERGVYCIRFDGLKSPNLLLGEDKYPFLYSSKSLAKHKEAYGDNSAEFWRMCRSFPCPEGDQHVIYSEADFIKGDAFAPAIWLDIPVAVSAADPAFTTDGDNFAVVDGLFGKNQHGIQTLMFTGWKYIHENMDLTKSGEPRDLQTARQFADHCRDRKVPPQNAASDASGPGGLAFGSILSAVWSSLWLPIKFGEAPSERPVSEGDPKRCDQAFVNKVTELWFTGRNFVRSGQIKGLPTEIAKQWKSRQYETVKGTELKMKVEPKKDMKKRVGFSPDLGDAALELIELCRERFGFMPGSMNGLPQVSKRTDWIDQCNAAHEIYNPASAYSTSPYAEIA